MELQDFALQVANWATPSDREALRTLRTEVFILEQHVPEALEWDEQDAASIHVLARDEHGQPIACGRLTPQQKIGRMAVLPSWRHRGVGTAILRELITRARALAWAQVELDAQVQAIPFYAREGFSAEGDVFEDAGIPHRLMRLQLASEERATTRTLPTALPVSDRHELTMAHQAVLAQARHALCLYLPELTPDVLGSEEALDELRRIATAGRGASIRILLHDVDGALRHGHRMVALAQRLPSVITIRTPIEAQDLAYPSAYLLDDAGGYVFQPDARRPLGRAALQDRAAQAPLRQHFNDCWERAVPARALQPLDI